MNYCFDGSDNALETRGMFSSYSHSFGEFLRQLYKKKRKEKKKKEKLVHLHIDSLSGDLLLFQLFLLLLLLV